MKAVSIRAGAPGGTPLQAALLRSGPHPSGQPTGAASSVALAGLPRRVISSPASAATG